jgi:hypothetical protein
VVLRVTPGAGGHQRVHVALSPRFQHLRLEVATLRLALMDRVFALVVL